MIVVDANVLIYLFIKGEHTAEAEFAFEKDSRWIAPLLWRSEVCNAVTGYIRRNLISFDEALTIMKRAERIMIYNEYQVPSENVLLHVTRSKCSAYDCEYIALAEAMNIKLVTSDKLILSEFPEIAISLAKFIGE